MGIEIALVASACLALACVWKGHTVDLKAAHQKGH
jgi:hypothetical protein